MFWFWRFCCQSISDIQFDYNMSFNDKTSNFRVVAFPFWSLATIREQPSINLASEKFGPHTLLYFVVTASNSNVAQIKSASLVTDIIPSVDVGAPSSKIGL